MTGERSDVDGMGEASYPRPTKPGRHPRKRHIPASDAEMHAWLWGRSLTVDEWQAQTFCSFFGNPPTGDIGGEVTKAFERLGAPRFWRWAEHGNMAAHDEEV